MSTKAPTVRLRITPEPGSLTIQFGPRKNTGLSLGISVWLFGLAIISTGAIGILQAGGFGVPVWSYFGSLLLAMWIFGLWILMWNMRFTARIFLTPVVITVDRGIWQWRKSRPLAVTPTTQFWLRIPAPARLQADYEFLGLGTWNFEVRDRDETTKLLRYLNGNEARQIAAALRTMGLPVEGGTNEARP